MPLFKLEYEVVYSKYKNLLLEDTELPAVLEGNSSKGG